jgi:DDE superfamily endonuclease
LIEAIRFDKGKTHDFDLYKKGDFDLSNPLEIHVDSGFQGIQKLHPNVQLPQKGSKLKPVNDQQKQVNTKKASKSGAIEHVNRSCKIFKIGGSRYRGKHKNHQQTWLIVVALVNLKTATKHLKFCTP